MEEMSKKHLARIKEIRAKKAKAFRAGQEVCCFNMLAHKGRPVARYIGSCLRSATPSDKIRLQGIPEMGEMRVRVEACLRNVGAVLEVMNEINGTPNFLEGKSLVTRDSFRCAGAIDMAQYFDRGVMEVEREKRERRATSVRPRHRQ